jgi:hypothetical protein
MFHAGRATVVVLSGLLLFGAAGEGRKHIRQGADLHVSFAGLICHVFDGQHAPRAVIVRGTASMPHRAVLTVNEQQVEATDMALSCIEGECDIDLENTAIRFEERGGATFERGGSFDTIVPHLQAVTNGEMSALRDDVFDEVPSPASAMSAYIELPAGSLTALPFPQTASFSPDFENRGLRHFPQGVFLTGHLSRPEIFLRKAGDSRWSHITFRRGSTIDLRLKNEPTDGANAAMHATLFYNLAKIPLANQPVISGNNGGLGAKIDVPGCSNSQWP